MVETVSEQIYKSRDRIRNEIISKLKQYLELENVDLTKSSFLSFIIDTLSVLTSDLLFYQISSYREFFLTKAQLPESIYNLAAFLGYNPKEAEPATVNVLFTIPFGFQDPFAQFTLPEGFSVNAGEIEFQTYYETTITVTNNNHATVTITEENRRYTLPVTNETDQFLFMLPFKQLKIPPPQEFQVSEDLQQYQFVAIDVPFEGQLADLEVEVRPPDSVAFELYEPVSSLFLMDSSTKGYVVRRTDTGVSLQFGNGLIGYQPEPGATIRVTLHLTNGEDGNIIAGTITGGDPIYYLTSGGITQTVQYEVVNVEPATGGKNEESIEEVRKNAIANISTLKRLVSENDFINANVVIEDSPIGQNSYPVLKRSDLKINEITLFSTLFLNDDLIPTKNLHYHFASTFVPRQTVLIEDGEEYYTIFDMEIDPLNVFATYTYTLLEIEKIVSLVTSYGSDYNLYANKLLVQRVGNQVIFKLFYDSTESDYTTTTCEMNILEPNMNFAMTNDSTCYTLVVPNYMDLPTGELTYFFTISHPTEGNVAQYSTKLIFRMSLEDFTTSNTLLAPDGSTYIVYDIPTVKKDYYDSIDTRVFELHVLQKMLTTMQFKNYRMLTDFINFKFANTTGSLNNMQLNEVDHPPVKDILLNPPVSPTIGDRYIVAPGATGVWQGHDNEIATLVSDSTSLVWNFHEPKTEEMVFVENQNLKYIFCESGWMVPIYTIPLKIFLDIFVEDTYTGSLSDLTQSIREALVSAFSNRFGINVNLFRSEIIDVVQEVEGVNHCRLVKPESSIFFNFDIDNFTQEQLLEYSPEYLYFTEDDIELRVF